MTWLNYKKNKRWTTRVLYDFYSTLTRDLLLTEQIPNTIVALRLLVKDITSSNLLMIFSHVPTKTTKKLFLNGNFLKAMQVICHVSAQWGCHCTTGKMVNIFRIKHYTCLIL